MQGTTLIAWYKAMRKALFVVPCHHYDRATKSLQALECGFCLLRHTKTWLARDIISYNGTMCTRMYFITS